MSDIDKAFEDSEKISTMSDRLEEAKSFFAKKSIKMSKDELDKFREEEFTDKGGSFYMGKEELPDKHAVFNWTPEKVAILSKCSSNILYFAENYFFIVAKGKKTPISLRPYQKKILRTMRDNQSVILLASRQASKTTLLTIFALWTVCFNDFQKVLIVANKQETAIEIFNRIKLAYMEMPNYLKPGIAKWDVKSMLLSNGSSVKVSATSADSARGQSVNVLLIDECVHGDTYITVRDKETQEIKKIKIEELYEEFVKNTKYEILTESGYKDFSSIQRVLKNEFIEFLFDDGTSIKVTNKHTFKKNNEQIYALDLKIGDVIQNKKVIDKKNIYLSVSEYAYDVVDVSDTHTYITNEISSSNCAIIDSSILDEFWNAVIPTVSADPNARIFLSSTPKGVGNKFYEIYKQASEDPESEWKLEVINWWDVPGRDNAWKEKEIKKLGSVEAFEQEYGNKFLQGGDSHIDEHLYEKFKNNCCAPSLLLEDGCYKVWDEPDVKNKIYVAGVDVAEGVGNNYSVIQILDITNLQDIKQVAQYHSNKVEPYQFVTVLKNVLDNWGNPPLVIERNNCGATVVDNLKHMYSYENIACYAHNKLNNSDVGTRFGVWSQTSTKSESITNLWYWLKTRVQLKDIETLKELKTFIRHPNGTWSKSSNSVNDDRVDSLMWALFILHEKVIGQFYEVTSKDENGKPTNIAKLYATKTSSQTFNQFDSGDVITPIFGFDAFDSDFVDLQSSGWTLLK